ncbi:MAG: NAD-dependent epimerase/dehydratase family protein [Desulfobacterales bacterium]|nr:NAD-dependent epimerase/dehydratase family protein [Desulfobacterales bacterium]
MLELRNKKILVTGGAGFIGSHLVDALIQEQPGNLIVIDNLFLGKKENLDSAFDQYPSLTFIEQDASEYEAMQSIIRKYKIDVTFNLAVIPLPTSLERPKWTVDQNIAITTTLCNLAKEQEFKTLIHFSSSEAYGSAIKVPMSEEHVLSPTTPYAASKAADDHVVLSFCETFNIDASILRPFNNYGPRQNDKAYAGIIPIVINKVVGGEPIEIFGDGEQTRDFLYVADTAYAAVAMYKFVQTRGQVTNVASGQEISVNSLVKTLLKILKAENHPVVHTDPRPGDVRRHCADIKKAQNLLNFNPKTNINDGLKATVNWYLQKVASN